MENILTKLYQWLSTHSTSRRGTALFALLMATEGLFIVPVSALLVFYCNANRPRSFYYAGIASLFTVISTLLCYTLGILISITSSYLLLHYLVSQETVHTLAQKLTDHQLIASLMVALSPLPFRTLTISAGFLGIPLFPFLFFTITARSIRFFILAASLYFLKMNSTRIPNYLYGVIGIGIATLAILWYTLI